MNYLREIFAELTKIIPPQIVVAVLFVFVIYVINNVLQSCSEPSYRSSRWPNGVPRGPVGGPGDPGYPPFHN